MTRKWQQGYIGFIIIAVFIAITASIFLINNRSKGTIIDDISHIPPFRLVPGCSLDKGLGPCMAREDSVSSETSLAFNDRDLRAVAGYFDDIFVGKIIAVEDTVHRDIAVYTKYKVEVIESLKGDLQGEIEVTQQGGLYDGEWIRFIPKSEVKSENAFGTGTSNNVFDVDHFYRFTTLRNNILNTNLLGPTSPSYVMLDIDDDVSGEEVRVQVSKHPAVREMQDAIADQIVAPKFK